MDAHGDADFEADFDASSAYIVANSGAIPESDGFSYAQANWDTHIDSNVRPDLLAHVNTDGGADFVPDIHSYPGVAVDNVCTNRWEGISNFQE